MYGVVRDPTIQIVKMDMLLVRLIGESVRVDIPVNNGGKILIGVDVDENTDQRGEK